MSDISIISNPDSESFDHKYEYPVWYNKKSIYSTTKY